MHWVLEYRFVMGFYAEFRLVITAGASAPSDGDPTPLLTLCLHVQNTWLSALLAVCNSAGEVLDGAQQTAVMEIGSQLWALLNTKLVRKAADNFPEEQIKY